MRRPKSYTLVLSLLLTVQDRVSLQAVCESILSPSVDSFSTCTNEDHYGVYHWSHTQDGRSSVRPETSTGLRETFRMKGSSTFLRWRTNSLLSLAVQNADAVSQTAQRNPSVERANSIIQKAVLAHGGEKQIVSVSSVVYKYQVESLGEVPSKPIGIKTFFKGDSFFRSEASGDNLDAITILNGDKGWVKVGDTILSLSRKEVDPLKISMIAQLRPELLLLAFPKRRYSGRIEENDLSLDQIEVSGFIGVEYVRGRLSFDVTSSRLSKYEYEIERESAKGQGIVKGEERYLRYGEKDGWVFPQEILSKQIKKTSRLRVLEADFNAPLSENLFEDPSPPPPTPK